MSLPQVLATLDAALQDGVAGLAVKAAALVGVLPNIRTDYVFEKWLLAGEVHTATYPRISYSLGPGAATLMLPNEGFRDGDWNIDINYEFFSSDVTDIQNNIAVHATALLQVLDHLREYSDAHGGTIAQVREPVGFRFGSFSGISSANGFTLTVTISERGTQ